MPRGVLTLACLVFGVALTPPAVGQPYRFTKVVDGQIQYTEATQAVRFRLGVMNILAALK